MRRFVGHDHCPTYGELGLSKLLGLNQLVVGSPRWAFGGCCTAVVAPFGLLTVGDFAVTGVQFFLFAFLVSS